MDGLSIPRDSMDDDELTIVLDEVTAEGDFIENYQKLRISQQVEMHSANIIIDHWPQPSAEFLRSITEQVKKVRIPLRCRVCGEMGEPIDFVLCGGCGAAHMPAHRQCMATVPFHHLDQGEENLYGSQCREVDFQEYIYTSWLMDARLRNKDQTEEHLDDIWSTWLGIPDGQDGPQPQINIYPRLERLIATIPNRPPRQYPSLVSIIGDTGSGKSTLIAAMIRMLAPTAHKDFLVPVPGADTDNFDSTSSDVHMFADPRSSHTEHPCFFIDCEGFSGTDKPIARQLLLRAQEIQTPQSHAAGTLRKPHTSKSAKEALAEHASTVSDRIDLRWGQLFTPVEASGLNKKGNTVVDSKTRHVVVKNLYPRLLYSFSDVVCFVTNNSRSTHNILQEMFQWAKEGHEKTLNQRVRPGLIIILNKMPSGSHNALASVNNATRRLLDNFEQSTRFSELQRKWKLRGKEIKTAEELILCYYDSFRVISIPQYTPTSPAAVKETSDQIKILYEEIGAMSKLIREKRQILNMELDVASLNAYLKQALINLGRDYQSTIDFHQLSDRDYNLPRRFSEHLVHAMANVAKQRNFDTSQAAGGEANLVFQMTPYIAACIVAQIEHESSDEAQRRKNDLVEEARRGLERFRARFWRCEAKDSSGQRRCKNYWEGHVKGHQFDNIGGRGVNPVSAENLAVGAFQSSYDPEAFAERLWLEVTKLRSREDATDKLAPAAVSCSVASITGQRTCLACLSNTPTNMLPCLPKQHCCSLTKTPWTIRVKPPTAGARILSLDGGGVRGIAELAILTEIEREVKMGIRGIIALGVFEKDWDLVDAVNKFKDLVKKAFAKRRRAKVTFSIITSLFCEHKYKTSGIETTLKEAFGKGYLFGQLEGEGRTSGDRAKVAVVTCTSGRFQPCLIANYNRNPAAKLQDGREAYDCLLRAEDQSDDFRIWQAARATSAAQTFFKPYLHQPSQMMYEDGAVVRNNPVRLAYEEARRIWSAGAPPDMVLSLGTGIQIGDDGKIAETKDPKYESFKKVLPQGVKRMVETGLDMVQATMNCQREWVDFKSAFRGQLGRNCHRFNIGLQNKPPSIDQVDQVDGLATDSQKYIRDYNRYTNRKRYVQPEYVRPRDHIIAIARRLLASLFYISDELPRTMPSGPFLTTLHCRLPPQSEGAYNILNSQALFRLKEVNADGEEAFHAIRLMLSETLNYQTLSGPVELYISEGVHDRSVEVQFPRRGKHWEPIGGF
ncbi:hypothetical protein NPX13_g8067 [Xylaria arbuscula]|uniref:PNPLA domain-containing protein n=1 Tax=Xylaria arbuscula TaxID=114810 RepID=A0A9W8N9H7_9PEZI|nr:hypothetical protein NPX13_g8067 [Xylaria arbuscula]